jgi:hypothetical protein
LTDLFGFDPMRNFMDYTLLEWRSCLNIGAPTSVIMHL